MYVPFVDKGGGTDLTTCKMSKIFDDKISQAVNIENILVARKHCN